MAFVDTQPAPMDEADHRSGLDPYAQFRVESPREIAMMLHELNQGGTPVQLSSPDGHHLQTVIWSVDPSADRVSMHAEPDHPHLQGLIEYNEATAVAYLEAVKLQFDLDDLVLVRGARASALQARLPKCMYRFQRRQAYRVRTIDRAAPTAVLRHPSLPDMQIRLRVLDVSIGGCALLLADDMPQITPGGLLNGVRIELDADTRFTVTLQLHHVTSIQPGSRGARLGCEFSQLSGEAERSLQRYIDQTQKRRRLLSLS